MLRSRGVDAAQAEDLVHEALLKAVAHPTFDAERAGPFLTRTVLNLLVDDHRQRAVLRRAMPKLLEADHQDGPEWSACERAELAWAVEQVWRLPARERDAVLLRASGLSPAEAARRLGVTYKAVETAYRRATFKLTAMRDKVAALLLPGVLRCVRLGGDSRSAALVTAVAVAAAGLVVAPAADEPSRQERTAPVVRDAAPRSARAEPLGTDPDPARPPGIATTSARDVARPQRASDAEQLLPATRPRPTPTRTLARLNVPAPAADPDVRVTREDEDEGLLETVQRCVREGITVDLQTTRCDN